MKFKTNGGVCRHAIDRVKNQYGSVLGERAIRRILREAKNFSGIRDGKTFLNQKDVRKLKVQEEFLERIFIAVIVNNDVVTVFDKPRPEHSSCF